jgi:hypothetical protein
MTDDDSLGDWSEFGTAAGLTAVHGLEALPAEQSFGDAPAGWVDEAMTVHEGFGEAPAVHEGFGEAPSLSEGASFGAAPDLDGLPPAGDTHLGEVALDTAARLDDSVAPAGYHDQVDADGDGHLDHATYRGDGHGGALILVDLNGDGHVDFIGHDIDLDNRVDYADYDKNHDGVFEERIFDTNHDGILDHPTWLPDS